MLSTEAIAQARRRECLANIRAGGTLFEHAAPDCLPMVYDQIQKTTSARKKSVLRANWADVLWVDGLTPFGWLQETPGEIYERERREREAQG